jgi:transposase
LGARALAADKKNAQKLKAWLAFLDESGFSQRPPIRATWAPRGQTPRVVEPFNWQRLSGIGAVLTHADGRRPRWLLALHRGSVRSAQVARFLQALRRHRRRPVILLWDRLPAHRSRHVQQALEGHKPWLRVEWLPAYAPELNPVEQLWAHLDATTLPNTPAEDLDRLSRGVRSGVRRVNRRTTIGQAFLSHTGLF